MIADYWLVVAFACAGFIFYACRKTVLIGFAARLRARAARRVTESNAGICVWGYNDRGELIHVRVKRKTATRQRVASADDIPEFLRSSRVPRG